MMSTPPIPAITLWQPWASLIAAGVKSFETRSWAPPSYLIGRRMVVHAAVKACPTDIDAHARAAIERGLDLPAAKWHTLPFGAVVCVGTLAGAYQVQRWKDYGSDVEFKAAVPGSRPLAAASLAPGEECFGDYRQDRWCWLFEGIEPFVPARPAKGKQGIWPWREVAEALQ
jgi:activating signal cointegrator 1